MRAEQEAGAFVPGNAHQKLRIIGIDNIGGEDAIVGGFFTKLVRFASEQQLDPIHAGDVGELVRDNRFGFRASFNGAAVEQDHRAD